MHNESKLCGTYNMPKENLSLVHVFTHISFSLITLIFKVCLFTIMLIFCLSILSINDLRKEYCYLTHNAFISLSVQDNLDLMYVISINVEFFNNNI